MGLYESGENYLETILKLSRENGNVRSVDIANELNFSKASVSRAVGLLRNNGYINVDRHGFITFTGNGLRKAEEIYERHFVITEFLVGLGIDKEIAEPDACRMEHDLSEETYDVLRNVVMSRRNNSPK